MYSNFFDDVNSLEIELVFPQISLEDSYFLQVSVTSLTNGRLWKLKTEPVKLSDSAILLKK